nr:AAC_HP1_G0006630.mRNA.1.CDS.1 [Saccharomyces cerevisiae]
MTCKLLQQVKENFAKRSMTDILPLSSKPSKRNFAMFRSERIKKKNQSQMNKWPSAPYVNNFILLKPLKKNTFG